MRIERTLKITPAEFYENMQKSMADQINAELGKDLSPEDIVSGYTHKVKTTTKGGTSRVTRFSVVRSVHNKEMVIAHHSPDAKSKTSYLISEDPQGCHLVYEQETEYLNPEVKPTGFRLKLTDFLSAGKINRQLTALEMQIEKERKKNS